MCKSGFLVAIDRDYDGSYFDACWTGNAISVVLAVAVMDEMLNNLFKQYGGIQNLGSIIFRWACGLLLLLSIVNALSTQVANADRVVAAGLGFDANLAVLRGGAFPPFIFFFFFFSNFLPRPTFVFTPRFGVFF